VLHRVFGQHRSSTLIDINSAGIICDIDSITLLIDQIGEPFDQNAGAEADLAASFTPSDSLACASLQGEYVNSL
jgi:hypothetical protein